MRITMQDMSKARYMGYKFAADYVRSNGVPFRKWFSRREEMNEFTRGAEECGCTLKEVREL